MVGCESACNTAFTMEPLLIMSFLRSGVNSYSGLATLKQRNMTAHTELLTYGIDAIGQIHARSTGKAITCEILDAPAAGHVGRLEKPNGLRPC